MSEDKVKYTNELAEKANIKTEEDLDLLHDIQWFCAFSMKGDSYGGDNGFIIENISEWNRNSIKEWGEKMRLTKEEFKAAHNNIMTVMENHIMMIAHCDRTTANLVANEVLDLDRDADRILDEEE